MKIQYGQATVEARVEKKTTRAEQAWTAILIGGDGTVIRKHSLTREQAIRNAANYLTMYDARAIEAKEAWYRTASAVNAEHADALARETS